MIYEKERRYIIPFDDVPSPRVVMPEIEIEAREGNFREVETGFPEAEAVREAKRCLSCRRCLGCALCWAECKPEAIDFSIPDRGEMELEFDEVVLTSGQENTFERFNGDLGYGRFAAVITDLQFERMLSPTGPTEGLVLSPFDGEIPERIAFVQGHPDGDEVHLFSSAILGVNEAIIALSRVKGLEAVLISPLCQTFRDRFQTDAAKVNGLVMIDGKPVSVEAGQNGKAFKLNYSEDGAFKQGLFDLIVVLTKAKIPKELKSLSERLEQEILS
jgi:heterodisulfide reductase subunit A-like polyferredoxin